MNGSGRQATNSRVDFRVLKFPPVAVRVCGTSISEGDGLVGPLRSLSVDSSSTSETCRQSVRKDDAHPDVDSDWMLVDVTDDEWKLQWKSNFVEGGRSLSRFAQKIAKKLTEDEELFCVTVVGSPQMNTFVCDKARSLDRAQTCIQESLEAVLTVVLLIADPNDRVSDLILDETYADVSKHVPSSVPGNPADYRAGWSSYIHNHSIVIDTPSGKSMSATDNRPVLVSASILDVQCLSDTAGSSARCSWEWENVGESRVDSLSFSRSTSTDSDVIDELFATVHCGLPGLFGTHSERFPTGLSFFFGGSCDTSSDQQKAMGLRFSGDGCSFEVGSFMIITSSSLNRVVNLHNGFSVTVDWNHPPGSKGTFLSSTEATVQNLLQTLPVVEEIRKHSSKFTPVSGLNIKMSGYQVFASGLVQLRFRFGDALLLILSVGQADTVVRSVMLELRQKMQSSDKAGSYRTVHVLGCRSIQWSSQHGLFILPPKSNGLEHSTVSFSCSSVPLQNPFFPTDSYGRLCVGAHTEPGDNLSAVLDGFCDFANDDSGGLVSFISPNGDQLMSYKGKLQNGKVLDHSQVLCTNYQNGRLFSGVFVNEVPHGIVEMRDLTNLSSDGLRFENGRDCGSVPLRDQFHSFLENIKQKFSTDPHIHHLDKPSFVLRNGEAFCVFSHECRVSSTASNIFRGWTLSDGVVAVKIFSEAQGHKDATVNGRLPISSDPDSGIVRYIHTDCVRSSECSLRSSDGKPASALVLELCEPGDAETHIVALQNEISSEKFLSHIFGLLRGLHGIHNLSIVHRDIKPSNVLFSSGPLARLRLADFGISAFLPSGKTSRLQTALDGVGTAGWCAPEQVSDTLLHTTRTDVFSFGWTMLFLCIDHERCSKYPRLCKNSSFLALSPSDRMELFRTSQGLEAYRKALSDDIEGIKAGRIPLHMESAHAQSTMQYFFADLFSRMVDVDPKKRDTSASLLRHPLFWSCTESLNLVKDVVDVVHDLAITQPRAPTGSEVLDVLLQRSSAGKNSILSSSSFDAWGPNSNMLIRGQLIDSVFDVRAKKLPSTANLTMYAVMKFYRNILTHSDASSALFLLGTNNDSFLTYRLLSAAKNGLLFHDIWKICLEAFRRTSKKDRTSLSREDVNSLCILEKCFGTLM
eukprot:ANDGO_07409.mRNA.1 Serine/threonine-protein kinase ppk4